MSTLIYFHLAFSQFFNFSFLFRNVVPSVEPGYLQALLPKEAPMQGENWKDILPDVERAIMPGVTHWHSPYFHGYYPTANSFPGIVGEMLSAGIGCIGFSWVNTQRFS